jgi:hypothetical protein
MRVCNYPKLPATLHGVFAIVDSTSSSETVRYISFAECTNGTVYGAPATHSGTDKIDVFIPFIGERSIMYCDTSDAWLKEPVGTGLRFSINVSSNTMEVVYKNTRFELVSSQDNTDRTMTRWDAYKDTIKETGSFSLVQVIHGNGTPLEYYNLRKRKCKKVYFFSNMVRTVERIR